MFGSSAISFTLPASSFFACSHLSTAVCIPSATIIAWLPPSRLSTVGLHFSSGVPAARAAATAAWCASHPSSSLRSMTRPVSSHTRSLSR